MCEAAFTLGYHLLFFFLLRFGNNGASEVENFETFLTSGEVKGLSLGSCEKTPHERPGDLHHENFSAKTLPCN